MESKKYNRRSIRLKGYDYSQPGAYFITICTKDREPWFEKYPELKRIIEEQWHRLPDRFPNIKLDAFTIMPNHIHGIIFVGAPLAVARNVGVTFTVTQDMTNPAPTLGDIVGAFKSLCVNRWLRYIKQTEGDHKGRPYIGKFWQRNYYEHIIRNDDELNRIRKYIAENPLKWDLDAENPDNWNRYGKSVVLRKYYREIVDGK